MKEAINVEKLSKSYQGRKVLDNLSLSVKENTVFGLLGANGAGKSTSIECMLGTRKPDKGTARILGMNPTKERKKLFASVGVQFQEANYQNEIKVYELCEETASLYQNPADWKQLLQRFGIENKERNAVKELSGATLPYEIMPVGMQRVVAIMPLTQGIKLLKQAVALPHLFVSSDGSSINAGTY